MAINKQINQLNNASTIGSSDYVALAQSNQSEATKATVADLASAIGQLNETGALSELVLATSMGKNLLAQRLTEKGITTSPSETLVQMADKVNQITTFDSLNLGKSKLVSLVDYTDVTSGNTYGRFHATRMNNGYTAVVANGKIYLCETEGNYSSLTDFLNSAAASITQTNASSSGSWAYIAASDDGSKLATYDFNGHIDVYSVSYGSTPSITYVSTVDASGTYGKYNLCLAINNAGTLVAYYYAWDTTCRLQRVSDSVGTTFSLPYVYNAGCSWFAFDNTEDKLYGIVLRNNTDSSTYYIREIDYTLGESSITVTTQDLTSNLSGTCDPYNKIVFVTDSISYPTSSYNVVKLGIKIYNIRTGALSNTVEYTFAVDGVNGDSTDPSYISWKNGLPWMYSETHNGKLIYECIQPQLTLKYDPANNHIELVGDPYQIFQFNTCGPTISSHTYVGYPLAYNHDMTKMIVTIPNNQPYYYEYGMNQYVKYCELKNDQLLGAVNTDGNGGLKVMYYLTTYPTADVTSGKYSLTTDIPYIDE